MTRGSTRPGPLAEIRTRRAPITDGLVVARLSPTVRQPSQNPAARPIWRMLQPNFRYNRLTGTPSGGQREVAGWSLRPVLPRPGPSHHRRRCGNLPNSARLQQHLTLSDVIRRRPGHQGAFYHHFATKGKNWPPRFIEQANNAFGTALDAQLAAPSPMLEKPYPGPFVAVEMMTRLTDSGTCTRAHGCEPRHPHRRCRPEQRRVPSSAQQRPQSPRGTSRDIDPRGNRPHDLGQRDGDPGNGRSINDNIVTRRPNMANHPTSRNRSPASLPYFTQFLARVEKQYAHSPLDAGPRASHSPSQGEGKGNRPPG